MRRAVLSTDDQLLARLQAAPDLSEGIESLAYWRERRLRLSWYRIRSRREAARMILRWEHRVHKAMLSQPSVPITLRISGALLVARTRLGRWGRRAVIGVTVVAGITVVVAPFVAVALFLLRVA
jgi:hypothetical protein